MFQQLGFSHNKAKWPFLFPAPVIIQTLQHHFNIAKEMEVDKNPGSFPPIFHGSNNNKAIHKIVEMYTIFQLIKHHRTQIPYQRKRITSFSTGCPFS